MTEVSSAGSATVFALGQPLAGPGERLSRAVEGTADQAVATFLTREQVAARAAEADGSRGASVAQLADRGLAQIEDRLDGLRRLAQEAEDATLGADRRTVIDAEFARLRSEIDTIVGETSFQDEGLLDATETVSFATGSGNQDSISFELLDATAAGLGLAALTLDSGANATTALVAVEDALTQVRSARAGVGGTLDGFQDSAALIATQAEDLEAARSEAAEGSPDQAAIQDLAATVIAEDQAAIRAQASQQNLFLLNLLN